MKFGTGAIKSKEDKRDYQFSDIAMALPPFDWEKGYDTEKVNGVNIHIKDQNGSSSCGGQSWSYYGQVLDPDKDEKSAKFIYAQTFVPGGGSAGRTNSDLVVSKGWGTEKLTPSYDQGNPPSEDFITRFGDITPEAFTQALTDKALSYARVNITMEDLAIALRENKGVIIGIEGKNNGTWQSKFPLPPTNKVNIWRHWVFIGKALTIDGKYYFGFVNSWGTGVGEDGWQYISEDYIPHIWEAWTLVYNFPLYRFTTLMKVGSIGEEVKQLQKRLGLVQDGIFGKKTKAAVIKYQLAHSLVGDGVVGEKTRAVLNKNG